MDKIKTGKSAAPGIAGQRGELIGGAGEADSGWQGLNDVPGAESKGSNNVRLPDCSDANRHGSALPYSHGPAKGTDTIQHIQ